MNLFFVKFMTNEKSRSKTFIVAQTRCALAAIMNCENKIRRFSMKQETVKWGKRKTIFSSISRSSLCCCYNYLSPEERVGCLKRLLFSAPSQSSQLKETNFMLLNLPWRAPWLQRMNGVRNCEKRHFCERWKMKILARSSLIFFQSAFVLSWLEKD